MSDTRSVFLHVWTGDASRARQLAGERYPDAEITELSHRGLREGGWRGQIKAFRALKGKALVIYFEAFADSKQTELIRWCGLLHHCDETAIVNRAGDWQVYRRRDWLWMAPRTIFSAAADIFVFAFWYLYLQFLGLFGKPVEKTGLPTLDVAYLFPYPLNAVIAGGAVSHIRGFLGGLLANRNSCRIFSGTSLPVEAFSLEIVPARRKNYIFWESLMLSYNFHFVRQVCKQLGADIPEVIYQRHGRFSVAGALLSRKLGVPLVLEYNGSEIWMADYWDPTRFRTWLRLGEEVMLKSAAQIVVVSDPLKKELVARGVPGERVLVNPNAVDPEYFHPNCGGEQLRKDLSISPDEIVVEFVGTFSHWHGVAVLQEGIARLIALDQSNHLRFLLIGEGPLHAEMREFLRQRAGDQKVIFTGLVSHSKVRQYLDAADILVSPHIPMPDGRPFFGSPTKLFEYMAMGKAIAASNLDQLAQVLSHGETAVLSKPGDVDEFVKAVQLLASNVTLRQSLGRRAREVAIERHTWARNAANMLSAVKPARATQTQAQAPLPLASES